jgi:hypothetical protein
MVVEFDEVERRAVQVLADAGLVPPLRHRPAPPAELADRRERPVPGTRAGGPAPRVYGAGHGRTPGSDRRGRRTG